MPMPPRPTALMIPIVTVCRRPNGLPIANTTSPARALSLSAKLTAGRLFSSIFNSATSVPGSVPIFKIDENNMSAVNTSEIQSDDDIEFLLVHVQKHDENNRSEEHTSELQSHHDL